MKTILVPGIAALILSACAAPTTGAIPVSDGFYTVAHQGGGFWVQTAELKAASVREASQFCESRGKTVKIINVKEIPAGALGRWPEAEATFACQ